MAAIREANRRRMLASVSLIPGLPYERPEDLRGTVHFLMDALRFARVRPQLHILSPLAGTAVHEAFGGRSYWDGIHSDLARQGWRQDSADPWRQMQVLVKPNYVTHLPGCIDQHPEVIACETKGLHPLTAGWSWNR